MTARLIAFEGIDGSGKTTAMATVAEALEKRGLSVWRTREPSHGAIGKMVRALLSEESIETPLSWFQTELLLTAERAHHFRLELAPMMEQHDVVLCDRYIASGLAYAVAAAPKGVLEFHAEDIVRQLLKNLFMFGLRSPDMTVLFELPVDVARERMQARGGESSRYDRDPELLRRVAERFDHFASGWIGVHISDNWSRVDATKEPDAVAAAALAAVARVLD